MNGEIEDERRGWIIRESLLIPVGSERKRKEERISTSLLSINILFYYFSSSSISALPHYLYKIYRPDKKRGWNKKVKKGLKMIII